MSDKSEVIRGSEKALRYLSNATDSAARQEILDEARNSGLTDPALSLVTHKAVYHTGESLSPAAGMAIDKNGHLVVSDEFNHRIVVYDSAGKQIREVGRQGDGDTEFHYPRGLCFDDDGNLYVADAWNHRIVVLAPDLSFKSSIGKLGSGEGELDEPVGVVWSLGRLAVLEKSNHRIQFFSRDSASMGTIAMGTIGDRGTVAEQAQFYLLKTLPEEFCTPVFEFPAAMAADSAGNLYVADTNNHRIVKVDSGAQADSSYAPVGLRHPTGLSVDKNDNLHVTQFNCGDIRVFSPDGILLYGYTPEGIELPVAIAVNGFSVYVGGGMKPGVSVNGFDPEHSAAFASENLFSFHFKKALAQFRAGNFDEAVEHLSLASNLPEDARVSALEFAANLPENDYAFTFDGHADGADKADGFVKILDAFSGSLWKTVTAQFDAKLAALDGYTSATLRLEKSFFAGAGDEDSFMVERFRAIRKLHNLSSEIKQTLAGFKKLQEFQRRLALCGIGSGTRLERIAADMRRFNEWKKSREQWYEAAEQAAPALTFNSGPDEREVFAQNQSRLEMFDFEFRCLWELAGEFNRELASLIRKYGWKLSPQCGELILEAVDFYLFCPNGLDTRLEYYRSLEDLFDAAGREKLSELIGGMKEASQWEALTLEDNIPYKTKPEVYRLLPALWSQGGLACDAEPGVEAWDKIVDFYNQELGRYIDENRPLRTELIRNSLALPAIERTDPKQARLVHAKLSLLWFHNYYQERYIGNVIVEYLVRFAIFLLADNPLDGDQAARTAEKLGRLSGELQNNRLEANKKADRLAEETGNAPGASRQKERAMEEQFLGMVDNYQAIVNSHLTMAMKSAARHTASGAKPPQPFRRIAGTDIHTKPLLKVGALTFDVNGNLYLGDLGSGEIVVFNEDGLFINSFAGHGSAPGRLIKPVAMTFTPEGELLVSQLLNPFLSLFTRDGRFIRRFILEGEEARRPNCMQFDSSGRLFASFTDGDGLAAYDLNGKLLERIKTDGTPLGEVGKLLGHCIRNDRLYIGGKGKLFECGLDGGVIKSLECKELNFDAIVSINLDENGNIFALDYGNNMFLSADSALTHARRIEFQPAQYLCRLATGGKNLALSDYDSGAVWLFDSDGLLLDQ